MNKFSNETFCVSCGNTMPYENSSHICSECQKQVNGYNELNEPNYLKQQIIQELTNGVG
jgi:predicted amidophosphoribosyltransferase